MVEQCISGVEDLEIPDITALGQNTAQPKSQNDPSAALDVLKASNREFRRLVGSKLPEIAYTRDFTFRDEKKSNIGTVKASTVGEAM